MASQQQQQPEGRACHLPPARELLRSMSQQFSDCSKTNTASAHAHETMQLDDPRRMQNCNQDRTSKPRLPSITSVHSSTLVHQRLERQQCISDENLRHRISDMTVSSPSLNTRQTSAGSNSSSNTTSSNVNNHSGIMTVITAPGPGAATKTLSPLELNAYSSSSHDSRRDSAAFDKQISSSFLDYRLHDFSSSSSSADSARRDSIVTVSSSRSRSPSPIARYHGRHHQPIHCSHNNDSQEMHQRQISNGTALDEPIVFQHPLSLRHHRFGGDAFKDIHFQETYSAPSSPPHRYQQRPATSYPVPEASVGPSRHSPATTGHGLPASSTHAHRTLLAQRRKALLMEQEPGRRASMPLVYPSGGSETSPAHPAAVVDEPRPRRRADSMYSRSPELRLSHKLAERKRRKEMKELFDELRDSLPTDKNVKTSKWEILSKAIEYISFLKRRDFDMEAEINALRKEISLLKRERQT